MVGTKEASNQQGYPRVDSKQTLHRGIVKGNRVRVNVGCITRNTEKR